MTEVFLKRANPESASLFISIVTHVLVFGLLLLSAQEVQKDLVTIDFVEIPSSSVQGQVQEAKTTPVTQAVVPERPATDDLSEVSVSQTESQVTQSSYEESIVGEEGLSSPTEVSATKAYQNQLIAQLNANRFYPPLAKKMRQQGVVLVQFRVSKSGKILEAKVIQESPFKSLNDSARKLVEGLHNLAPFPAEITKTTWLFEVPVKYQM
ncbi:MAG: energy transducer TonB, partial [Bdellovibrionales bacterium]|nr:energy transducer TonB [Bdellovibrionales bacterium]